MFFFIIKQHFLSKIIIISSIKNGNSSLAFKKPDFNATMEVEVNSVDGD